MKQLKSDILIVGGGLTGLLTAFVMSSLNKKIIIVDKFNLLTKKDKFDDFRTTAISEGSKNFLTNIKFWQLINKYAEPIKFINVIDRSYSNKINFYNAKQQKNLGYIIKNAFIKNTLIKKISTKKNITIINNQKLKSLNHFQGNINSLFKDYCIETNLLIAADGKNSSVRELLKSPYFLKKYNHEAIVVNLSHYMNHKNTAYELFFNTGPLAILPMQNTNKELFKSSIIWSIPKSFSYNLKNISLNFLKKIIEEKVFKYIGKIRKIDNVQFFPLSAHLNHRFYDKNVVYLGDAAHSIHPIAGQGWNLGVRDIRNLYLSLKKTIDLGLDVSNVTGIKSYHNNSFYDAYNMFQITDKLNSIFLKDSFPIHYIRKTGFDIIQKNEILKKYITNYAMGL